MEQRCAAALPGVLIAQSGHWPLQAPAAGLRRCGGWAAAAASLLLHLGALHATSACSGHPVPASTAAPDCHLREAGHQRQHQQRQTGAGSGWAPAALQQRRAPATQQQEAHRTAPPWRPAHLPALRRALTLTPPCSGGRSEPAPAQGAQTGSSGWLGKHGCLLRG